MAEVSQITGDGTANVARRTCKKDFHDSLSPKSLGSFVKLAPGKTNELEIMNSQSL
ncbi:hypothetical protein AAJCM20276_33640 [Acetobacter aceti]|uniref:Uncharacterized protein n=1 Tax=Acetobacter aceti TaxID=435 RepID=A0A6S6PNT8_ACEAC|nr:hypothetical protein AAJCM20276_33640 [Acetobacter aceti]